MPLDQDTLANAQALEGRHRLTGAFLIETSRIRPDPTQPRRSVDKQKEWELSASIERHGILQPITVRYVEGDNVYQVISGERRFQAACGLGMREIPCWVRSPKAEEILVHQITENWQRVDLHPFDLADTLLQLRDRHGYSQKEIAELTGKPESEISKILSLLKLRASIQQQHRRDLSGDITRRHLQALAKLSEDDQDAAYARIVEQKLTAQDTERLVREKIARSVGAKRQGAPVGVKRRFVTGSAVVTMSFRKGQVTQADLLAVWNEVHQQIQEATDA